MAKDTAFLIGLLVLGFSATLPGCTQRLQQACGEPVTARDDSPRQVAVLGADLSPIRREFNAKSDQWRAVALVSPTCSECVFGAEAVQREITARYPANQVAALIVWIPMLPTDNEKAARESATIFPPQRAEQFYDSRQTLGKLYAQQTFAGFYDRARASLLDDHWLATALDDRRETNRPQWDLYMLYAPGARWQESSAAPPIPTNWIRHFGRGEDRKTSTYWQDTPESGPRQGDLFAVIRGMADNTIGKPHAMSIEVLGFEGCPNTPQTRTTVEKALRSTGLAASVVYVDQMKLPDADLRRGWPSPTVLVNGHDLFGMPEPDSPAMGCRTYAGGSPSVAEVSAALRNDECWPFRDKGTITGLHTHSGAAGTSQTAWHRSALAERSPRLFRYWVSCWRASPSVGIRPVRVRIVQPVPPSPFQEAHIMVPHFGMALVTLLVGAADMTVACQPARQGHVPFQGEPDLKLPGVRQATGLCAGDFNRDGRVDLAMLSGTDAQMVVLLNRGDTPFQQASLLSVDAGASASSMAIGDFNEDGEHDVAVCHHDTNEVWVFFGEGNWKFQPARSLRVPVSKPHAHAIVAAHLNGDKHLDLLLAQSDDNCVWAYLGDGRGGFTAAPNAPIATDRSPYVVVVGDFNGDNVVDFATPNASDKTVSVFLGDGTGGFRHAPGSPISGLASPLAIAVGDVTGDRNLDLVIGNNGQRGFQILEGNGEGGFSLGVIPDLEPPQPCFRPILADLDGNGTLDVAGTATNDAPTFSFWLNHGSGKFGDALELPCAEGANTICVVELNGDGLSDLVVGTDRGDQTFIWFGKNR